MLSGFFVGEDTAPLMVIQPQAPRQGLVCSQGGLLDGKLLMSKPAISIEDGWLREVFGPLSVARQESLLYNPRPWFAALAQLVEQFIRNEKVASSIPASGTILI